MKKITVFGASGGIGQELVLQGMLEGYQVRGIYRKEPPLDETIKSRHF